MRRKKILSYFFPSLAIPYRFGASKKLVIKLKKPFHLKCCGTDAELREQRLDLDDDDYDDEPLTLTTWNCFLLALAALWYLMMCQRSCSLKSSSSHTFLQDEKSIFQPYLYHISSNPSFNPSFNPTFDPCARRVLAIFMNLCSGHDDVAKFNDGLS